MSSFEVGQRVTIPMDYSFQDDGVEYDLIKEGTIGIIQSITSDGKYMILFEGHPVYDFDNRDEIQDYEEYLEDKEYERYEYDDFGEDE